MTNREQIEQAIISAGAYTGNETEKLLNELYRVYEKAQAFYKISKLKDNIKFIKDVSLSHATEEPVNQEMYWVHSLMDSLLEGLEDE